MLRVHKEYVNPWNFQQKSTMTLLFHIDFTTIMSEDLGIILHDIWYYLVSKRKGPYPGCQYACAHLLNLVGEWWKRRMALFA